MPTEPLPPPPGIVPVDISIRQMQSPTYQLSTGPRRNDTITHKLFDKQAILDDIQAVGFYSPFHAVRVVIAAYPGDTLLLVADPTEKYGSNWYLCTTEDAKARETEALGAAERAAAEQARRVREEEERKAAEEHRLATLVVHEQPLVARPYVSASAEDTAEDVRDLSVRRSRPLLALRLQRRRYAFGAKCSFNDRDYDAPIADFRPRREPNYELKRMELTVALQAGPSALSGRVDAASQTTWFAPRNMAVQCDVELDASAAAHLGEAAGSPRGRSAAASLADPSRSDGASLRDAIQAEIALAAELEAGGTDARHAAGGASASAMEQVADVLFRALPLLDLALSQNETLNIYRNDLALLVDDDVVVVGSADAKHVREERQFLDLELTAQKALVAVEWHPTSPSWFAVSAVPTLTFEARVAESAAPRAAHVLLFTLAEFSNQMVLEAPADVMCMHWNPTNASVLVVGLVTGQVALFDMTAASAAALARKRENSAASAAGGDGGEEGEGGSGSGSGGASATASIHVKPRSVSLAEAGHGRPVVGIRWLPPSHHLNQRLVFAEEKDGESHQFISAAADGTVCVWDERYRERLKSRRRVSQSDSAAAATSSALQSAIVPGAAAAGVQTPSPEVPWVPHYKVALRHGASAVHMTGLSVNDRRPSEPLVAATEEGRVVAIDWAPQGEGSGAELWTADNSAAPAAEGAAAEPPAPGGGKAKAGAAAAAEDGEGGAAAGGSAASRILWVGHDTDRPPVAVARSPFFPHVVLAVNEFTFSLWMRGVRLPVFTSPASPQPHTVGRWSPTRPGVLVIGRSDGVMDVWDLLDTTTKPALSSHLFSSAVASMEFRHVSGAPSAAAAAGGAAGAGGGGGGGASSAAAAAASAAGKQLLAVGDAKGSLHILDFPLPLRRGSPGEESLVSAYLNREAQRAAYVVQRGTFREAEKARKDGDASREKASQEAAAAKLEAELQAAVQAMAESDPAGARALNEKTLLARKAAAAQATREEAYSALEASLMAQLGVRPEDIVSMEAAAAAAAAASAASGRGGGHAEHADDEAADEHQSDRATGDAAAQQQGGALSPLQVDQRQPQASPTLAAKGKRTEVRPPAAAVSGGGGKAAVPPLQGGGAAAAKAGAGAAAAAPLRAAAAGVAGRR